MDCELCTAHLSLEGFLDRVELLRMVWIKGVSELILTLISG